MEAHSPFFSLSFNLTKKKNGNLNEGAQADERKVPGNITRARGSLAFAGFEIWSGSFESASLTVAVYVAAAHARCISDARFRKHMQRSGMQQKPSGACSIHVDNRGNVHVGSATKEFIILALAMTCGCDAGVGRYQSSLDR